MEGCADDHPETIELRSRPVRRSTPDTRQSGVYSRRIFSLLRRQTPRSDGGLVTLAESRVHRRRHPGRSRPTRVHPRRQRVLATDRHHVHRDRRRRSGRPAHTLRGPGSDSGDSSDEGTNGDSSDEGRTTARATVKQITTWRATRSGVRRGTTTADCPDGWRGRTTDRCTNAITRRGTRFRAGRRV